MSFASHRPVRRGLVLATVLVSQLMVVLDATVVNVAIPKIQGSLHFSAANLSWIINAYALTFGGLLLLGARIGDILGRRTAFIGGIALFTLSSLVGGAAQSSGMLVGARAVQGIGAAIAAPSALALLTTLYEEGKERTRAVGYYTAVSVGGGALGLILGGVLTQIASWRWVLFINVPIGAVLLVASMRAIAPSVRKAGALDIPGAVTSTVGMSALSYGFVDAAQHGWGNATTIGSLVAGVVLLTAFVLIERSAESPITPLRLFASRDRSGAYLGRLFLVAGMQGMFFYLTQFLQDVLGYSSLATGFGFLPITIALFASSQASARWLLARFGARLLMGGGMSISVVGMAWASTLSSTSSYLSILGPLVLIGAGNGLAFLPLTQIAISGIEPRDAGAGAGMVNAMQQVGGALGLSVLVTISGSASRHYLHGSHPGLSAKELADHAFVYGADHAFRVSVLFLLLCMLISTFVISPPAKPGGVVDAADAAEGESIAVIEV